MSACNCERCGKDAKTYWVNDKLWLCAECFKAEKGTQKPPEGITAIKGSIGQD